MDMYDVKSPLVGQCFHDLRHTAITKLAESQASDKTIMAIAGRVSRQMLEHYSHIRMAAKRVAVDSISTPLPDDHAGERAADAKSVVHQNDNQINSHQEQVGAKSLI